MSTIFFLIFNLFLFQPQLTAEDIINKVDENMFSDNRVIESKMIVKGRRGERVITSKSWSEGDEKALTEYLSPAREEGTKMLKLEDELYIYSPNTDRTIRLSGHMLRQSVMGSDLSYEDMMEERELLDIYDAILLGEETIENRVVYVLELTAKVEDVAYSSRKIWVDIERFVPLKEELFAKSGQLLKTTSFSDVEKIEGRWFPRTVLYKDVLKDGEGTVFTLTSISFNANIPEYLFSKAALKQ